MNLKNWELRGFVCKIASYSNTYAPLERTLFQISGIFFLKISDDLKMLASNKMTSLFRFKALCVCGVAIKREVMARCCALNGCLMLTFNWHEKNPVD